MNPLVPETTTTDPATSLATARSMLESAEQLLIQPTARALQEFEQRLATAAELLRRVQSCLTPGDSALLDSALQLRQTASRVALLLERAGEFHAGWLARLTELLGDYSALGRQAQRLSGGARVSVEG
ncbi:MAG: hypothetical protein HYR60_19245 [Acidobacteria bacterium]|nr:hypothetical protein [Acidobacteriota bacterium]